MFVCRKPGVMIRLAGASATVARSASSAVGASSGVAPGIARACKLSASCKPSTASWLGCTDLAQQVVQLSVFWYFGGLPLLALLGWRENASSLLRLFGRASGRSLPATKISGRLSSTDKVAEKGEPVSAESSRGRPGGASGTLIFMS